MQLDVLITRRTRPLHPLRVNCHDFFCQNARHRVEQQIPTRRPWLPSLVAPGRIAEKVLKGYLKQP